MRLAVTRPSPEAEVTAARLTEAGHRVIVAPVLAPVALAAPQASERPAALLVTSPRTAEFLTPILLEWVRSLPVFAVGNRTAVALRGVGAVDLRDGGGDAAALARAVASAGFQPGSRMLHVGGVERAGDIETPLAASELIYLRSDLYRMDPVDRLPEALRLALAENTLNAALHYSRATVRTLIALADDCGQLDALRQLSHHCLSEQVAEPFRAGAFSAIRVATRPNETALLATLGN